MAYLIGELFRSTLSDKSPLEPQLISMHQKVSILASLGLVLEDALVAIAIILSLPESYTMLRTVLMATQQKMEPESVIAQILVEEKGRSMSDAHSALLARGAKGKGKASDKTKKEKKDAKKAKKCDNCKKRGHTTEECRFELKESKKDQKSTEQAKSTEKRDGDLKAKVATIAEETSTHEVVRLFAANVQNEHKSFQNHWIIDSSASSPMSSHCLWFHMFKELNLPKKVWLGNNSYILATGIGQLYL